MSPCSHIAENVPQHPSLVPDFIRLLAVQRSLDVDTGEDPQAHRDRRLGYDYVLKRPFLIQRRRGGEFRRLYCRGRSVAPSMENRTGRNCHNRCKTDAPS